VQALQDRHADVQTPEGHFWSLLNEQQRQAFIEVNKPEAKTEGRRGQRQGGGRFFIVNTINELVRKPEFYNAVAFENVKLDEDLRATDDDSLSIDKLSNRNLRRLETAFARYISVTERNAMLLTYAGFDLTGPLPFLPSQMKQVIDGIITVVLGFFLGIVGVFASLLFTATMIPRTFEPGEISLLLSKPVHRSFLFLTKFLGGCVFTLICAALLVTGIWLLLGLRLEMWRAELLWCIPLYVFLFAIYFSVSALAGAVWRNAVVSLILVIVFWLGLTLIGFAHNSMNEFIVKARRLSEISANGGEVFSVDGGRTVQHWDHSINDWSPVPQAEGGEQMPAFLQRIVFSGHRFRISVSANGKRILALQPTMSRVGGVGSSQILSGNAEEQFELQPEPQTPEAMFGVFQTAGDDIILPGSRGIYRFAGLTEKERKAQTFYKDFLGGLLSSSSSKAFESLTDKSFPVIAVGSSVAFNPANDAFLTINEGKIRRIERTTEGKYTAGEIKDLEWKESAVLATGGILAIIGRADGTVMALNAETFAIIAEASLPDGEMPRTAECAPDGSSAAVLTHSGIVLVFDASTGTFLPWTPRESGYASAIGYDEKSRMMVVDHHRSVRIYDIASQEMSEQLPGSVDLPCRIYDYVVSPLHKILPKPGDLDNAVRWIVTGEKSVEINNEGNQGGNVRANLEAERVTLDVWNAILSNLAFITVMLGLGCLYIARSDF
ncbi:MAG: ABC transporter permease subunit, partial [Planctomycetota bacterium]|nr:ABC transporter permease subunit [Planctomycetota bacterium]